MGSFISKFVEDLVSEEIDRIVAEAVDGKTLLATSAEAARIARTYPNSGLDERDLAQRIIMAAIAGGVPVEIGTEPSKRVAYPLASSPGK